MAAEPCRLRADLLSSLLPCKALVSKQPVCSELPDAKGMDRRNNVQKQRCFLVETGLLNRTSKKQQAMMLAADEKEEWPVNHDGHLH